MGKVISILSSAATFLLFGCAGQFGPPGGPIDKTPPKIISTSPTEKETRFSSDRIEIKFSKYMSQRSVESAVYLPPFNASQLAFDWSGKTLTIALKEPLAQDQTYILTIGTGAPDLRNNHLAQAYNLVFSTGAHVDTGSVSGQVFADKPRPFTVAAFAVTDSIDTLRPFLCLPKYVTQSDDSGLYVLQGLAVGKYRLIAFDDQVRNFMYAPQVDAYSSADRDIEVTGDSQSVSDVNFIVGIEDTTPPQMFDAEAYHDGIVIVKFSEPVDSENISPADFNVSDSATQQILPVRVSARSEAHQEQVYLCLASKLRDDQKIVVIGSKRIKDLSGNELSPSGDTVMCGVGKTRSEFTPWFFNFTDSTRNVSGDDTLSCQIILADPDKDSAGVVLLDSLKYEIKPGVRNVSTTLATVDLSGLNSLEWYTLRINYHGDLNGQDIDTVIDRRFRTIDRSSLGEVTGDISGGRQGAAVVVVAKGADGKKYYRLCANDGTFDFTDLPSGDYSFSAYVKHGPAMGYFFGQSYPFKFSEPFGIYPQNVHVRARWTVEGIQIRIF